MLTKKESIARAHKIAAELEEEGHSAEEGGLIMAMALGIFMESQKDSHRNLDPLRDAMLTVAQKTFDALREGRSREHQESPP